MNTAVRAEEIFWRHPINRLMLEGSPLPKYDPEELGRKPIMRAKSGLLPTKEQVEAVRTGILAFCEKVHGSKTSEAYKADVRGLDETWPEMYGLFAGNLGLTQLMLDYGVNSRFFYQYLWLALNKLFGVALEMKDGWGIPISAGKHGKFFEKIPMDDWMIVVATEDPNHAARRGTDGVCQTLLRKAKNIFDAGAGLGPVYRHYDYPLGQLGQKIVACDSDSRLLDYFPSLLPKPLSEYGIDFVVGNAVDVMSDPKYEGRFDVVRMTGFISYLPTLDEKMAVMARAKEMLNDNGVIVADWWVLGPATMRSAVTNIWPNDPRDPHRLQPSLTVDAAVQEMRDIYKSLGLPHVYTEDPVNGNGVCWTQSAAAPECVISVAGKKGASLDMLDMPA